MTAQKTIAFIIAVCIYPALGQLAVDHVGNIEDVVDGYRFEYHDAIDLLLIIQSLDCFVVDMVRHTPLADKLENLETRTETQRAILELINQGAFTATSLGDILEKYPDALLRALCFRSEMYTVDVSSLQ